MKRALAAAACLGTLAIPSVARAEPEPGASAAAQALFYEARALMNDHKYGPACAKLEESLRLDYGMGTEFNLADCNEKLGKTASAWSGFVHVAAAARGQGQPQREKVARERAKALEVRLPKLQIEIAAPAPPGIEVRRDDVAVGPGALGTSTPVDPGPHRVLATAPGRQDWASEVTATEGKTARVVIPVLQPALTREPVVAPAEAVSAEAPAPMTAFPEPVVATSGGTQRAVGLVVGALGIGALGVGAGFGLDSMSKRDESRDHCSGDACDATGLSLRDRAITSGDVATVSMIAGGAALLGGIVLFLTAPRRGGSRREAQRPTELGFSPQLGKNGGGLSLQGIPF